MRTPSNVKKFALLGTIIGSVAIAFLILPREAHAITIEPIHRTLQEATEVKQVWRTVRNIINVVLIAVLIYIAFINILGLHHKMDGYAIKKFLPALVLAVIAANFSYLICRFLIDVSNAASVMFIGPGATDVDSSPAASLSGAFNFTEIEIRGPQDTGRFFLLALAEFAGSVALIVLAFLFFIRNYIIYFLVGISPLAFLATALPATKQYFSAWWKQFFNWTFMPVVTLFWLWLGGTWAESLIPDNGEVSLSWFLAIIFAGACYYLAIKTPFDLGGGVMKSWGGFGKKIWSKTGGAGVNYTKTKGQEWTTRQKTKAGNALLKTKIGSWEPGKWMLRRQMDWKLNNEGPQWVREKMTGDALEDQMDYRVKNNVGSKDEIKRYKSKLRGSAGEESRQNTSIDQADVQTLVDDLKKDANGFVYMPDKEYDVDGWFKKTNWNATQGGKEQMARLFALVRKSRSSDPAERQAAQNALAQIQTNWAARDPALGRNPRTLDLSGYQGTSAVLRHESIEGAAEDIGVETEEIEAAAAEISLADGEIDIEKLAQARGIRVDEETRPILQSMATDIAAIREGIVGHEKQHFSKEIQQESTGTYLTYQRMKSLMDGDGKLDPSNVEDNQRVLKAIKNSADQGKKYLASGDMERAQKQAAAHGWMKDPGKSEEEVKQSLERHFSSMDKGIEIFERTLTSKARGDSGSTIADLENERLQASRATGSEVSMSSHLQHKLSPGRNDRVGVDQIDTAAEISASIQTTMQAMKSRVDDMAAQFEGIRLDKLETAGESLEKVGENLQDIVNKSTSRAGGDTVQLDGTTMKKIISETVRKTGTNTAQGLDSALRNSEFQRGLAREIATASATKARPSTRGANHTNQPQVSTSQPNTISEPTIGNDIS